MSVLSIFLRNLSFFFFSCIFSGTLFIIPQIFFLEQYPEHKNILLASFLIAGMIAGIIGMHISQKNLFCDKKKVIYYFIFIIVSFISLFWVKSIILFFITGIILRYFANYLYNLFDLYFVNITLKKDIKIHVQATLFYQILGILFASFYFPYFFANRLLHVFVFCCIGIVAYYYARKNLRIEKKYNKLQISSKLSLNDIIFISYSFFVFSLFFIFQGFIIYMLRDYYYFDDIKIKGGLLLGIMYLTTTGSIFLTTYFRKHNAWNVNSENIEIKLFSIFFNIISLLLLCLGGTLVYLKLKLSFTYLAFSCMLMGLGGGVFLSIARNYASNISVLFNKPNLLSIYNNIRNYAALLGFSIILVISIISKYLKFELFYGIFLSLGMLFVTTCVTLILLLVNFKKNNNSKKSSNFLENRCHVP